MRLTRTRPRATAMREGVPSAAVAANVSENRRWGRVGGAVDWDERECSAVDGKDRTRANEGDRAEGSRVGW
eukprot:5247842-Pleurochrysis_carterae.AAC.1